MKKAISLILAILIMATLFVPIASAEVTAVASVVNGGFEDDQWEYTRNATSSVVPVRFYYAGQGRNGSNGLMGVNRTKATTNPFLAYSSTDEGFVFNPEKEYVISFWVKTSGDFNGCVFLKAGNAADENIIGDDTEDYVIGTELEARWATINYSEYKQVLSAPFKVSENGVLDITVGLNGSGMVFFDDFEIIENPDAGNMLQNGGFEKGEWNFNGTSPIITYDDTHNSVASAKLSGNSHILNDIWDVDTTKSYTLSMSLKTVGMAADSAYVRLMQVYSDGSTAWKTVNANEEIIEIGGSLDWASYSLEITDLPENLRNLVLYIYTEGEGYLLIDNVRFAEIAPYEAVPAGEVRANIEAGKVNANTVLHLFSADDSDIYYTLDGSNPVISATRYLYNGGLGILVTEDINLRAVAAGSALVYNAKYTTDSLIPNASFEAGVWQSAAGSSVAIDTANHAVGNSSMKITAGSANTGYILVNDHFDYTLSFRVKTVGMSSDNAAFVSLFLKGVGIEYLGNDKTSDGGVYYSDRYGSFQIKANQDWTYYTLPIYNLSGYGKLLIEAGIKSGASGTAYFDDFKLVANEPLDYALSISGSGDVNGNIYTPEIKPDAQKVTLYNRSREAQTGKLTYNITDLDGRTVKTGEENITVEALATLDVFVDIKDITKYGLYTINFSFTDKNSQDTTVGTLNWSIVRDASASTKDNLTNPDHAVLGVSSHAMTGGYLNGKTDRASIDKYMDMLKKAGVTSIREEVVWANIEHFKDHYTFPEYWDDFVDSAIAHDMEIMLCLNGTNSLHCTNAFPKTAEEITAFANFTRAVAEKFNGRIFYYELFNETNFTGSCNGAEYTAMLKEFYSTLKAVNSSNKVLAGVLSLADTGYTRQILAAGGADYMDIYSFHPYVDEQGTPEVPLTNGINAIKQAFTDYNITKDIPFWFTEIGYSTALCWRGVSADKQADYHIRANAISDAFTFVDRYFHYETHGSENPYSLESGWGMTYYAQSGINGYSAHQSYAAFAAKNAILDGFSYSGNGNANGVYLYKYYSHSSDKDVYMVWTDDSKGVANISVSSINAVVTDIFGNERQAHYGLLGTTITEEVSGRPIYLTVDKNAVVSVTAFTAGAQTGGDLADSVLISNGNYDGGLWGMWNDASSTAIDNTAGKGNSTKFTFGEAMDTHTLAIGRVTTDITESLDLTKKYRLNISAKATEGYTGKVFVRLTEQAKNNADGSATSRELNPGLWYKEWYFYGRNITTGEAFTDGYASIPTEWSTFSTDTFAITGAAITMQLCVFGANGTLWIDDISLTPVDVTDSMGKVTAKFDPVTGDYTLTAKGMEGYELSNITAYTGFGDKPVTEPKVIGKTGLYETKFKYNIDDVTTYKSGFNDYSFPYIITEFVKTDDEITLSGDSDGNSVVDIRDLVRSKKFVAGVTDDIDLMNADVKADGYIKAEDLSILRKYLIW